MRICLVGGARPNFVKIAPIMGALERADAETVGKIRSRLIHTGQHYDHGMSQSSFDDPGIRVPDANLGCGSGRQADVTGAIMEALEGELREHPAELVLVVGDAGDWLGAQIPEKWEGRAAVRIAEYRKELANG